MVTSARPEYFQHLRLSGSDSRKQIVSTQKKAGVAAPASRMIHPMNKPNVPENIRAYVDNFGVSCAAMQSGPAATQYPSPEPVPIVRHSEPQRTAATDTLTALKGSKRWLLWRLISGRKVPFYTNGERRHGALDSPEDVANLATYENAERTLALSNGGYEGIAIALGRDGDGYWQGIDLDDVFSNGLSDLANHCPGYVEKSPSGRGCHALGYGRHFKTLGSNASGIEAYCEGRFFTFTEETVRGSPLVCLGEYVEQVLRPRHSRLNAGVSNQEQAKGAISLPGETVTELRSALNHLPADDYHLWVKVGQALSGLGQTGRGLWIDWSQASSKFNAAEAAGKWGTFTGDRTGYQAVFKEAQAQGWINPISNAAQLKRPIANASIILETAMTGDTTAQVEYLSDPWLPERQVVGFYGRGGTAKSSFLATQAALLSGRYSSLWISTEEPTDQIKARHIKSGGEAGTLHVFKAIAAHQDEDGSPVAASFNIYEHLDATIEQAKILSPQKPLRLVVLDTAVALTTWGKGESANDDGGVKRLTAYLLSLCDRHGVTIAIIGHVNKGKHDNLADTVAGSSSWTSSLRQAFMCAYDQGDEYSYAIRTVKNSLTEPFAALYRTHPVHTLQTRSDGSSSVLCAVTLGPVSWGNAKVTALWDDATKRPGEASPGAELPSQKQAAVNGIVQAMDALLREQPGANVTRDQVEERIGEAQNRRHWQAVDEMLDRMGVEWVNGERGKKMYRTKPPVL